MKLPPWLRKRLFPQLNTGHIAESPIPASAVNGGVPKIIHQTCRSREALPDAIQNNIQALKARNPGWQYCLYSDADIGDFISAYYGPRVLRLYQRINPRYGAARADLFRYLVIYRLGGVYLDIKSTARLPLDDLIRPDDRYLLASWGPELINMHRDLAGCRHGELQQWHVIGAPGHPFLKAVIDAVLHNIEIYTPTLHGVGKLSVLQLTGPIAYTLAISPLLDQHAHRFTEQAAHWGLSYSVLGPNREHQTALGPHYSQVRESLVAMTPRAKLSDASARALNVARRVLRR